ncbi:MAG: hypothetical protein KH444_12045 [Ruminococcus sp.]|nr:hypothetical protein [Ruminococcus sp.]
MKKAQPEKYYEACITYNIIKELNRIGKKVYPYSISQRDEKEEGYDFGYHVSENSFLIQYKSPNILKEIKDGEKIYTWEIDREQLDTLNKHNGGIPTYYALPAFDNIFDWYSGIQKTYFIDSKRLATSFDRQTKTSVVRSDCKALKTWDYLMEKFREETYDYAIHVAQQEIDLFGKINDMTEGLWLYCLEK